MPQMQATCAPGALTAMAGREVWLLFEAPVTSPATASIRAAVDSASQPDNSADDAASVVLAALVDEGLKAVGSFVILAAVPDGFRVIVHGRGTATVSDEGDALTTVVVTSPTLWIDQICPGVRARMSLSDDSPPPHAPDRGGATSSPSTRAEAVPLRQSDVVAARSIEIAPAPDLPVLSVALTEDAAEEEDGSDAFDSFFMPTMHSRPALTQGDMAPAAAPPPSGRDPGRTLMPGEHEIMSPGLAPTAPAAPSAAVPPWSGPVHPASSSPPVPVPPPAPIPSWAPAPPGVPAPPPSGMIIDAVPTFGLPPQSGFVPSPAPGPSAYQPGPPPSPPQTSMSGPGWHPGRAAYPAVGAPGAPEPIPPQPVVAPPTPAAPSQPVASAGVVNQTVNRSTLGQRGPGQSAPPQVQAAQCGSGHFSPAHAGVCRVCRVPMPANPVVFWTPRPVLGRLVSSNGDVFVLDRGLILGRAPSIPEGHLGDPPNLVKLVDPSLELSSQHLEIRLDHWLVLAVDLGSTNGSDVIIPGREPVRLVAGVPEMLEPGAVVSLADVLTLTYEVW